MSRNIVNITLLLSMLFITKGLSAQQKILGKVKDSKTAQPIPFVHIYNESIGVGATTNLNGEYNLMLSDTIQKLKLIFSHISYESKTINLNTTKDSLILLDSRAALLAEVSVSPIDPFDILKKCVLQIKINYPVDGFMIKGFQREVVTAGKDYVQLTEAEYLSVFKNGDKSTEILNGRFAENKPLRVEDKLWNDKRGGFYVFGITALGDLNAPFQNSVLGIKLKNFNKLQNYYDLTYSGKIEIGEVETYVLEFNPNTRTKRPLITGTLYIDTETFALVEMRYAIDTSSKRPLKINRNWQDEELSTAPFSKKIQILNDTGSIKYRPYKGKWFLSSIVQDTEVNVAIKLPLKTLAKSTNLNFHVEQIVSEIDDTIAAYSIESIPTDMYYYQVYLKNHFENYRAEDWDQFKSIKGNVDYSSLVKTLEEINSKSE